MDGWNWQVTMVVALTIIAAVVLIAVVGGGDGEMKRSPDAESEALRSLYLRHPFTGAPT